MADLDSELRDVFEGIGRDVSALRKALAGTNKSILENTKNNKAHAASQKVLLSMLKSHQKILEERGELTEELNEELEDQIKAVEKSTKATNKAGNSSITFTGVIMKAIKFLGKLVLGAAEIGLNFGKTSSQIKGFQDAMESGFDNIPYIGKGLSKFAGELDDNVQLFRSLAMSGASFGSSISRLRMAAYDAGMPLVQFQELIQNNSTTLARLFGSVDQGVLQFVALGRGLRQFQMDELAKFGITMEETNEFLTTFAEIERARGQAEGMTSAKLLEGTQAYTKNLILLSKLTGQSVTELDKQQRALAADGAFQAKLAQMDEKTAERVRQSLSLLPASAQQAAKEIIGLGAPISDAAVGLQALSGGQFGDALRSIVDGSETDLLALSNTFKEMGTGMIKGGDAYASAAFAGNSMMQGVLDIFAGMAGMSTTREELDKQLAAKQGDNIDNMVKMSSALDRTTAEVQRLGTILLNTTLFDPNSKFGHLLEKFVDDDASMSKKLVNSAESTLNWMKSSSATSAYDGKSYMGYGGYGQSNTGTTYSFRNLPPIGSPEHDEMIKNYRKYQHGSDGFQNFGTGTPAVLHGVEAVVPKDSMFGTALTMLTQLKNKATSTTTGTGATAVAEDQTVHTSSLAELVKLNESNQKVANHLNKLVTIGAMTEKNTKDTKNNLANVGSSLV